MKPPTIGALAVVMVPVVVAGLLVWIVLFGARPAEAECGQGLTGPVDAARIPAAAQVAGFGRAQLKNAAAIANAAAALGLDGSAETLGVQAAIGESGLANLTHGDGAINPNGSVADSLGLFQQQSSWGTVAQRMDPSTAAGLFFARLKTVPGWAQMAATLAINTVQGNADPYYYAPFAGPAASVMTYLAALGGDPRAPTAPVARPGGTTSTGAGATAGTSGACVALSGDARALAQQLMQEIQQGRLVELEPAYQAEIAAVAAGTQGADCGLDPRILQLIQLAVDTFHTVGISDLNRRCTGSLDGAGTQSSHWINGGGQAVDFFMLDGTALTGGDVPDLQLLQLLDGVVPVGARAGQVDCRPPTVLQRFTQFDDTCNHQHVDLAYTNGAPLTLDRANTGTAAVPTGSGGDGE